MSAAALVIPATAALSALPLAAGVAFGLTTTVRTYARCRSPAFRPSSLSAFSFATLTPESTVMGGWPEPTFNASADPDPVFVIRRF